MLNKRVTENMQPSAKRRLGCRGLFGLWHRRRAGAGGVGYPF